MVTQRKCFIFYFVHFHWLLSIPVNITGMQLHTTMHAINDQDVQFIAHAKTAIECYFLLL